MIIIYRIYVVIEMLIELDPKVTSKHLSSER